MPAALRQAITLVKAGDKSAARSLLRQIVTEEPDNEHAWGWLAYYAENDAERRRALEQVIEINPENAAARQALEKMCVAAASEAGDWAEMIEQEQAPKPKEKTAKTGQEAQIPHVVAVDRDEMNTRKWVMLLIIAVLLAIIVWGMFVLIIRPHSFGWL